MKSIPWTEEETVKLCGIYNDMQDLDAVGKLGRRKATQVSKASIMRQFREEVVPTRTKGSVEAKLMNLAACRKEMGLPLLKGYVPLPNMSKSCRSVSLEYWAKEVV